jgi:hypothetical protein
MNKAKITSLAAMSDEQVKEDMKMTALERLTLAFQISDFAIVVCRNHETNKEEESKSIHWIELRKVAH